jgi:VWFA-related protein
MFRLTYLFGASLLSFPAFAQSAAVPATNPQTIRLSTKEVVLDIVVRDKRNRLVSDLQPSEIEVYEDGVKQQINHFEYVEGNEQLSAETSAAKVALAQNASQLSNSLRQVNFVSIVFGPMAPGNLDFARQAVFTFLKSGSLTNTFVTIYRLDMRLRVIQPYTQDLAALNRAATLATKITSGKAGDTMTNTVLGTQSLSTALAGASSPSTPGSGNPMATPSLNTKDPTFTSYAGTLDASTSTGQAALAQAELSSKTRFVENYATGMTMLDNLGELIRSQARVQGRKVILYLSDGLTLPQDREEIFSKLVSDANRSGVTFFTLDTKGLSVDDPMAASVAQQNRIVGERSAQDAANKTGVGTASFDVASLSDDVQLQAVADKQLALRELAERTGGFATANTNELAAPMQRVMEDIRSHYEVAYVPISNVYDGHFRKIEVRLSRPRLRVQTRQGYYALPELNGEPLEKFELTALNALNTRPIPRTFPYKAALMQFKPGINSVQCQMVFEVPVSSLSFVQNPKTGTSILRASVFALIQDSKGQVVGKISRELFRDIPAGQVAAIKDQQIQYAEPIDLAPGRYTLSTVALDEQLDKVSVKRVSELVDPIGPLWLSSVEIIEQVDPLNGPRDPLDPFEMDNRRVSLSSTDNVPPGRKIPLYFVVYPAAESAGEPLKLTLQLFKEGKEIARVAPEVPKRDSTGAIPMVLELSPPAGDYDVRITAQQGANLVAAERSLTVGSVP